MLNRWREYSSIRRVYLADYRVYSRINGVYLAFGERGEKI